MEMAANLPNDTNTTHEFVMSAELSQYLKNTSLIIYFVAFVLGVLGNGVVIWVIGFEMKKTVYTLWLLNLAVADFFYAAFLPLNLMYLVFDICDLFVFVSCKLSRALRFLNMFASVYILMVISVDRCVSVFLPFWARNHRSVRKATFVSLSVWVMALIFSAPYFNFRDIGSTCLHEDIINCGSIYPINYIKNCSKIQTVRTMWKPRQQALTISRFLLGFVVPFTVIVSCYAGIIHRLRRNRTLASQSSRPFKIIAAVITTFFLCWAPYHIMALIEMVNFIPAHQSVALEKVSTIGIPITTSLATLNSCLNPLLYVFMGQDFKNRVPKSMLSVLKSAFQEEVSGSHPDGKSVDTSQSKEKSAQKAEM